MSDPRRVLVLFVCWAAGEAAAGEPAPRLRPAGEALPPIFVPRTAPARRPPTAEKAPAASQGRRAISPETAAKLATVTQRAVEALPAPAVAGGPRVATVSNSGDVLQLEPYVVEEEKFPEFKQRHMLTPEGKLELAYKRHPGLKLGRLPLLNDAIAREMLEQEFAKERRAELEELSGLLRLGAENPPAETKRIIDRARLRVNEKGIEPGTPFRERP